MPRRLSFSIWLGHFPGGVGYIVERMDSRLSMTNAVGGSLRCVVFLTALSVVLVAGVTGCEAQANPASAVPGGAMAGTSPVVMTPSAASQATTTEPGKATADVSARARSQGATPAREPIELTDFQQLVAQSLGYSLPIYLSLIHI